MEQVYVERRRSSNSSRGPPRLAVPYYGKHEAEGDGLSESERRSGSYNKGQTIPVESPFVSVSPRRSSCRPTRIRLNTCSDARIDSQYRTSGASKTSIKDGGNIDTVEEREKRKQMRNKTFLYAGLAGITTIAASNNIYQSTKASMTRRQQLSKGGCTQLKRSSSRTRLSCWIYLVWELQRLASTMRSTDGKRWKN